MDSQGILYSKGSNDECYTPRYVVKELMPYLPKDKVFWCPFDTEESEFVKVLSEEGFQVVNSHISLQLLMFRNRIKFLNNGIVNNKITFSSSFYCWNLLPKQIIISDK